MANIVNHFTNSICIIPTNAYQQQKVGDQLGVFWCAGEVSEAPYPLLEKENQIKESLWGYQDKAVQESKIIHVWDLLL